jgi:hypothetical protein
LPPDSGLRGFVDNEAFPAADVSGVACWSHYHVAAAWKRGFVRYAWYDAGGPSRADNKDSYNTFAVAGG